MFDAIVVGIVLLSTFIYTFSLMAHINMHEKNYKLDLEKCTSNSKSKNIVNLVEFIEKDFITGAYTHSFIKEIIEKELKRAQRYKIEFSCILIEIDKTSDEIYQHIGKIISSKIRANDYFGILEDGNLIVITSNTSLSGAMILAEKFDELFKDDEVVAKDYKISFGITSSSDSDTLDSIIEKLHDAIENIKSNKTNRNIEIEA
jgi:CPA1 family monovalent cation:H+ antiporter